MKIITLSRQFGSGGREIAKRLSDELGIAYYDNEIITEIAARENLDAGYVERTLENGFQWNIPIHYARTISYIPIDREAGKLLATQHVIMKEIAARGDAIFVGRAADVVLREHMPFRIFIYADMAARVARCQARGGAERLSDKQMEKKIRLIDKNRALGYDMVSALAWGDKEAYDLCINTGNVEIKKIVPLIAEYAREFFKGREK